MISAFSGKTMRPLLKEARDKQLESKAWRHLLVVVAGVFDIVKVAESDSELPQGCG